MSIIYSDKKVKVIYKISGLCIFMLFFLSSCGTTYTMQNLPKNQLYFGEGGGFAGREVTFLLLENGQIFEKPLMGNQFEVLGKIKRSEAKKFYKEMLLFKNEEVHKPGNSYSFIRFNRDTVHQDLLFSQASTQSDNTIEKLAELHEKLIQNARATQPLKKSKKMELE